MNPQRLLKAVRQLRGKYTRHLSIDIVFFIVFVLIPLFALIVLVVAPPAFPPHTRDGWMNIFTLFFIILVPPIMFVFLGSSHSWEFTEEQVVQRDIFGQVRQRMNLSDVKYVGIKGPSRSGYSYGLVFMGISTGEQRMIIPVTESLKKDLECLCIYVEFWQVL